MLAFQVTEVEMPLQATTIEVHYSQANAPVFLPSNTGDDAIELMDVWMIPLMPPPLLY